MAYAEVIVDISHEKLDKPFQYRIPKRLEGNLEIGMSVVVPFGKGDKPIRGYVIGIKEECSFDPARTKEIRDIDRNAVSVESRLIRLAEWIHVNYGSTMIQALKTEGPDLQAAPAKALLWPSASCARPLPKRQSVLLSYLCTLFYVFFASLHFFWQAAPFSAPVSL